MRTEAVMRMEATRSNRWRRRDRTDGGDAIEPEPPSSEELIHDGSAQGKGGDAGVAKVPLTLFGVSGNYASALYLAAVKAS
ncbi:hypothetical protein U1Q18_016557 [Sarracenia purpurea var. burkii]